MSSASAASSSSKKVEWYHLDRVALAKRIFVDNTTGKPKTALNNNNNNNNYSKSSSTGSAKTGKSIGSNVTTSSSTNNPTSVTSTVTSNSKTSTYDHLRAYPRPTIAKEGFNPGNTSATVGATSYATVDPSKGIFTLRYNTANIPSSTTTSSYTSTTNRQLVLQQKRRRKVTSRVQPLQQQSKCKRFLDEASLIVNGATKSSVSSASSCGSSSRSSSSGVSSDFEELDTTNMKVTSSSRTSGHCQSSSSECEEEDEEGSPHPIVTPYVVSGKACKGGGNININNNNNLSVVTNGGAGVGVGGKSVMMCKGLRTEVPVRTINGKIPHKAMHHMSHLGASDKIPCKVDPNGSPSSRCKLANGSSHSSASSTTSGSTDNDRDTDNSFSEFPPDLDFIGVGDKSKRRTDRYDSSESSDSGVATLSPSTSDSPELISTCCDFTSEHLDVGNLISANRSSSSSYPTTKSSSSSSSASSCSGSTVCLTESQGEATTSSGTATTTIIAATLPSSTGSDTSSLATNSPVVVQDTSCMWKGCTCSTEASHNILEHIQTTHVAPQMKTVGYVCLWEGCKVFNKRSSSLSWLERHVLSHSGNKPFKCIFPGCGLSFSSQNALERHVNSHIATNGTTNATQGNSTVANKKIDTSPAKSSRRKKIRFRKQRINIGQRVDYFDKRIMEVIKHWLASSVDQFAVNAHDCTFRGEIVARRVVANCGPQVLARWHPRFIIPDEWIPESKYSKIKLVPLRRIPSNKIRLLYPALFPPVRHEKASRKRKPRSNFSPSTPARSTSTHSEGSSSLTTLPPSPNLSPLEIPTFIETGSFLDSSSRSTRSSSSSSLCSFSSSSSTINSSHHNKNNSTAMMMDSGLSSGINSGIEQEEDKCHKKLCGCLSCDSESALLNDDSIGLDFSHWASEELYEELGIFPS